jgi:hypothetical protein
MDNLPAHKITGVRQEIEAAGARLLGEQKGSTGEPDPTDRTALALVAGTAFVSEFGSRRSSGAVMPRPH